MYSMLLHRTVDGRTRVAKSTKLEYTKFTGIQSNYVHDFFSDNIGTTLGSLVLKPVRVVIFNTFTDLGLNDFIDLVFANYNTIQYNIILLESCQDAT